jgi:hypothetical protein
MTNDNGNSMVMPVAPAGYGGGFGGGFGGDWGWIILLLLCGWGGFGGGFGGYGGADIYPWMNQADITTSGFQNLQTNNAVSSLQNSVTSGFGDVQTALCGGFAGVTAAVNNGFAQTEIADNARQMANMQQMFGIQSALQNCCCENRANIADLKYTVATENCADRAAISDGLREVITNQTANTQKILDALCSQEIQQKNDRILELQNRLNMATLAASQVAQTQQIIESLTPVA